eukprot:TRINITY_DN1476_c0_g1_i5.p1 TRINITY_DN1476_c0_g1~~TRINITY_DN1476_c0_g1_i5.p1  ORF type:complete len:142 (-),score=17.74 TRINITY_DN1476_c0_g1_i5:1070-1456(-)
MYAITPERRPASARGNELTTSERLSLVAEWGRAIVPGAKAQLCRAWQITTQTASAAFRKFNSQLLGGGAVDMSRGNRKGRPSGIEKEGAWEEVLGSLEVHKRKNYRKWARAAAIPKSTLHRWAKAKQC